MTSLLETTSGGQREIMVCVAILSDRMASVCEASSVMISASASDTSSAAAGMALSTSAGQSSKRGLQ